MRDCVLLLLRRNFYSRPYARGDYRSPAFLSYYHYFYSRPYARGDALFKALRQAQPDFYSRPYARGDSNFSQNHKLIYMINC